MIATQAQNGTADFIDEARIYDVLKRATPSDPRQVRDVIAKARLLEGLDFDDITVLMNVTEPALLQEIYDTGSWIKDEIYGSRLVLFAPLYISNYCRNECEYCAFRRSNKLLKRRALTQEEIASEVKHLVDQGHKRVLMVAGESYPARLGGFDYILKSIETIYSVKSGKGEIRRLNVNIAPLALHEFKRLKKTEIGTYQIFQETYHRDTYRQVHLAGMKTDYDWRITAPDRAMQADIDDVGIGVLFGLYDWKFELLAMMQHIRHLEARFGVGPHTISVPRLEPACGSSLAEAPPYRVSDADFRKICAIIRLAVPYTGMIMSTRETAEVRRQTFALGVSQISAGSRTNPGGYSESGDHFDESQFSLGDHRSLDEVVRDCAEMGYIPSFCTACYRTGRTGADFMDLAKPGLIKQYCGPNALASFYEYVLDYASNETKVVAEKLVKKVLAEMDNECCNNSNCLLQMLHKGHRDVYQ